MTARGDSQVEVTPLKTHNGRPLRAGDSYALSYVAALSIEDLLAGRYIDSSEWYKRPIQSVKGEENLLPGLESALADASFGDTLRVVVPAGLAFGRRGVPGRVAGDSKLYFQVEVIAVGDDQS